MVTRRVCLVLLACACLFPGLPAAPAAAEGPVLALVYTANSFGKYNPCPTCNQGELGGLGRRATYFKELRKSLGDRVLFIAGGHEFQPLPGVRPDGDVSAADLAPALAKGYTLLGYQLIAGTSGEAGWLKGNGGKAPAVFRPLGEKPAVEFLSSGGLRIAAVLFPEAAEPAAAQYAAVVEAARSARAKADLVLGVSTWGESVEKRFLDAAGPDFDMLLGSGQGMGAGCRVANQGRTLWVRPVFDSWGVQRVDVLARPGAGQDWQEGRNYTIQVRWMDATIPLDPQVSTIFSWI